MSVALGAVLIVVGLIWVVRAPALASKTRRGTEWRPRRYQWRLVGALLVLAGLSAIVTS